MQSNTAKKQNMNIVLVVVLGILVLLSVESLVLVYSNRQKAQNTASLLVNHISETIRENDECSDVMTEQVKEDYINRAEFVATLLAYNTTASADIDLLKALAEYADVDEIHLFDTEGTIYFGTVPEYYGINMNDGEQVGFFLPMLTDKTLSLCQDPTPNTAEEKPMMYAMTWSNDGTYLVQIGMQPTRLYEMIKACSVPYTIENTATSDGVYVLAAESATGIIIGATDKNFEEKTLTDLDINIDVKNSKTITGSAEIDGNVMYYSAKFCNEYIVIVLQDRTSVNRGIIPMQVFMLVYLIITAVVIWQVVRSMTKQVMREAEKANKDRMTGVYNRFAYENYLDENPGVPADCNFVYAALDLNGLKTANDTLGHDAGDEMIKVTAECMRKCFGECGTLYRTGGDEFVALLSMAPDLLEEKKKEFVEMVDSYSGRHFVHMSVSAGYVMTSEFPERTVRELAKIADDRMYLDKEEYYKKKGVDRRRAPFLVYPATEKDVGR